MISKGRMKDRGMEEQFKLLFHGEAHFCWPLSALLRCEKLGRMKAELLTSDPII